MKEIKIFLTEAEERDLDRFVNAYQSRPNLSVSKHAVMKMILHYGINSLIEKREVCFSSSDNSTNTA